MWIDSPQLSTNYDWDGELPCSLANSAQLITTPNNKKPL